MPTSSGVSITPGITQFTRTPFCATSAGRGTRQADRAVLGGVIGTGAGEPALGADRGGVDHRARTTLHHVGQHEAQAEEHAAQVYVQHLVEFGDVVFVGRGKMALDPGIVEEAVDPAHRLQRRLRHRLRACCIVGDIGVVAEHGVTGVGEGLHPLL